MDDRTPLIVVFILLLAVLVVYINMDLFRPGYQHPEGVTRHLTWQGEPIQRSLRLREGLDLQGGLQVLLKAQDAGVGQTELELAAQTIQNRVDTLGVIEPLVQTQGTDKIVVELPGVAEKDMAVRTIKQTALLEFIYAGSQPPAVGETVRTSWGVDGLLFADLEEEKQQPYEGPAAEAEPTEDGSAYTGEPEGETDQPTDEGEAEEAAPADEPTEGEEATAPTGEAEAGQATGEPGEATAESEGGGGTVTVYPTVLTGDYLSDAVVGYYLGEITVNFSLASEGGRRMREYTEDHIGEVMAIALDKKIISAPVVRDPIADNGQISGDFGQPEAEALVAQLRSGALPVQLKVVGQTHIGPTLGREAVDSAIKGGVVGLIVVVVFMLVYYRMPGLLADLALMLYALTVLSLFRLIPVTLTLAGIAGFILSIGIAVDANILIFERMKEELRAGRRVRVAMDAGFTRAWPSIRDSNFSTLITCAILFWFGNQFGASIVKGFAVTLALGIVTSLFTAITVTRTFLRVANRLVLREAEGAQAMESPRLRALFGF